jgi:hypothetical protein
MRYWANPASRDRVLGAPACRPLRPETRAGRRGAWAETALGRPARASALRVTPPFAVGRLSVHPGERRGGRWGRHGGLEARARHRPVLAGLPGRACLPPAAAFLSRGRSVALELLQVGKLKRFQFCWPQFTPVRGAFNPCYAAGVDVNYECDIDRPI